VWQHTDVNYPKAQSLKLGGLKMGELRVSAGHRPTPVPAPSCYQTRFYPLSTMSLSFEECHVSRQKQVFCSIRNGHSQRAFIVFGCLCWSWNHSLGNDGIHRSWP
jgi:hypothetical protein